VSPRMKTASIGRILLAVLLIASLAVNPAMAGPRPISVKDWDRKETPHAQDEDAPSMLKRQTNNFAPPKEESPEREVESAPQDEPEPVVDEAVATEQQMTEDAAEDARFDAPILAPATAPAETAAELDSPIAPPAKVAEPDTTARLAMPIEEAMDAPISTEPEIPIDDDAPFVLVPSVEGFEEGEYIQQYTQLDIEDAPVRGGQVRGGGETFDMNDVTVDQLFEIYEQRRAQQEVLNLSLEDALRIALVQNLDIQVAEFDALRSDGDLLQAKGEFDPVFNASSTYNESMTSPSAQTNAFAGFGGGGGGGALSGLSGLSGGGGGSSLIRSLGGGGDDDPTALGTAISLFAGVVSTAVRLGAQLIPFNQQEPIVLESEGWQHSIGVNGKLHYGTEYDLRMNMNVEESTFSGNTAEWDGGLTLRLTQPLLKGFGKNANLARIRSAKNSRIATEYQIEQQVQQSISEVMKTYWDLVGAYEQLRVSQRSLSNAAQLLQDNEQRLEIGTGTQLDVTQAKSSVSERQADVVNQRLQIVTTENRLKQLLDLREEITISPVRIVPTAALPEAPVLDIDREISVQRALDNKPEIQASMVEVENAVIEFKRANNDLLPELDLTGSYTRGGRGSEKGDIFDGIEHATDESWSVGAEARIPITNRQARGQHITAVQSMKQAERRLTNTKQQAIIGVHNAVASISANRIGLEARQVSRAFQETNVEKQETSLRLGATTSFEVLRTQEDLASAEAQEVQARIELEKSLVDLELAEGTILENHGIEFIAPERAQPLPFVRSLVPPAPAYE
jgi:outer membrane protein TolC